MDFRVADEPAVDRGSSSDALLDKILFDGLCGRGSTSEIDVAMMSSLLPVKAFSSTGCLLEVVTLPTDAKYLKRLAFFRQCSEFIFLVMTPTSALSLLKSPHKSSFALFHRSTGFLVQASEDWSE